MKRVIQIHDPITLLLAAILTGIGLFFAFDAGFARSLQSGHGAMPSEFVFQLIWLPVALIAGFTCTKFSPAALRKWSNLIWIGCLVLLLLAIVPPFRHAMNGAERWVKIGPLQFQPAEFAKLGAVIYFAAVFTKRPAWPKKIPVQKNFALWMDNVVSKKLARWAPALWILLGIILIEKEPDMGTGLVIAAAGFAIAAVGGATKKSLLAGLLLTIVGASGMLILQPYRWTRIANHFQRWETQNIDDSGYQTVQSEIAMAGGGLKGIGSGAGHAKHLMPATTTDFVMATVGEEYGFLGSITVLTLLGALVIRILYRAGLNKDRFAMLTMTGIATWLGFQGCVNLLQANGTLPPIGIPFPFVSSGGSSLLALWAAIGVTEALAVVKPIPTHAVVEEGVDAAGSDRRRDGRARLSSA